MNLIRGLIVCLAMAVSGSAMADAEFYAGIGLGSSDASTSSGGIQNSLMSKGYNVTAVSVDSKDSGWRFLTGLRFTDNWAVELGFVDLGNSSLSVDATIPPAQAGQFNQDVADAVPVLPRGMTLAAVVRFTPAQLGASSGPTADRLNFALKLGVIDSDAEREAGGVNGSKAVNADPYYGLTVGWDFDDRWRAVVGYEVFNLSDSTTYLSAGVEFKFPTYK